MWCKSDIFQAIEEYGRTALCNVSHFQVAFHFFPEFWKLEWFHFANGRHRSVRLLLLWQLWAILLQGMWRWPLPCASHARMHLSAFRTLNEARGGYAFDPHHSVPSSKLRIWTAWWPISMVENTERNRDSPYSRARIPACLLALAWLHRNWNECAV